MLGMVLHTTAHAAEIYTSDNVHISAPVESNTYAAGGQIFVASPIAGDLIGGAGNIDIRAEVGGDLLLGGGQINVSSPVQGDVRVAGGNILIAAPIAGDLIVTGGNVVVTSTANIGGELIVAGGSLTLDATVAKNARIGVGSLVLNGTILGNAFVDIDTFKNPSGSGVFEGNLTYSSKAQIPELEAIARGEKTWNQYSSSWDHAEGKKMLFGIVSIYVVLKMIGYFLLSLFLVLYFPKFFRETADILTAHPGKSFLFGILLVVTMPVIALVLMITVVGIPLGLLAIILYGFALWFCNIVNITVLSAWVFKKNAITGFWTKALVVLGMSIVLAIVPIVGFVLWLFTVGALLIRKGQVIQSLR